MPIVQRFQIKEMEDLTPGEMFICEHEGLTLAIAMRKTQDGDVLNMLILRSGLQTTYPCHSHRILDGSVLSYGTDWILDLGFAEDCYPGNAEFIDIPGSIVVTNKNKLIRVASDRSSVQVRAAYYDLELFGITQRTSDIDSAVCIRNWSIWLNEEERTRQGGKPLFTHTHTAQPSQ